MKTHLSLLAAPLFVLMVVLLASFGGANLKYSAGAPAGYTNSPADAKDCSHCMGGSAVVVDGWITSDIPVTGYEPGTTYTITATATGSGDKGFQISPQDDQGNLIGTLIAGTGNQLVGGGKYVTHSNASGGSTAVWTFQWTAPSTGVGDVTFYGCFAVGKSNTKITTLTVAQSTVGIDDTRSGVFTVFPNPATDHISLRFFQHKSENVLITLVDINGKKMLNLYHDFVYAGLFDHTFSLPVSPGTYALQVQAGDKTYSRKLIIH